MSTNYSPRVLFYGDHDHRGQCVGQLRWNNTSSTVDWLVDGEVMASFSSLELKAFQLAASAESYGVPNVELSPEQWQAISDSLPFIGGFKNR